MTNLSVRGLDPKTSKRLRKAAAEKGKSLNRHIVDLLSELGPSSAANAAIRGERHDDLDALAGTWSAAQLREFERATRAFNAVDEALWR